MEGSMPDCGESYGQRNANNPPLFLNAHLVETEPAATSQARFPVFGRFVLKSPLSKMHADASVRSGEASYTSVTRGRPFCETLSLGMALEGLAPAGFGPLYDQRGIDQATQPHRHRDAHHGPTDCLYHVPSSI